jgi:hypothetical protein
MIRMANYILRCGGKIIKNHTSVWNYYNMMILQDSLVISRTTLWNDYVMVFGRNGPFVHCKLLVIQLGESNVCIPM